MGQSGHYGQVCRKEQGNGGEEWTGLRKSQIKVPFDVTKQDIFCLMELICILIFQNPADQFS